MKQLQLAFDKTAATVTITGVESSATPAQISCKDIPVTVAGKQVTFKDTTTECLVKYFSTHTKSYSVRGLLSTMRTSSLIFRVTTSTNYARNAAYAARRRPEYDRTV